MQSIRVGGLGEPNDCVNVKKVLFTNELWLQGEWVVQKGQNND